MCELKTTRLAAQERGRPGKPCTPRFPRWVHRQQAHFYCLALPFSVPLRRHQFFLLILYRPSEAARPRPQFLYELPGRIPGLAQGTALAPLPAFLYPAVVHVVHAANVRIALSSARSPPAVHIPIRPRRPRRVHRAARRRRPCRTVCRACATTSSQGGLADQVSPGKCADGLSAAAGREGGAGEERRRDDHDNPSSLRACQHRHAGEEKQSFSHVLLSDPFRSFLLCATRVEWTPVGGEPALTSPSCASFSYTRPSWQAVAAAPPGVASAAESMSAIDDFLRSVGALDDDPGLFGTAF